MKKKNIFLYLITIKLMLMGSVFGQELSLERCISIGLEKNLSINKAELDLKLNSPAKLAAWGQFLPPLNNTSSTFKE